MTGCVPLSSRCFRSSFEMRGTGTAYCECAVRGLSTFGGGSASRDSWERHNPRFGRHGDSRRGLLVHDRLRVDVPSRRAASAVDAAQEDRARLTPRAEVVTPRQVAIEPVPHNVPLCLGQALDCLLKRKSGTAPFCRPANSSDCEKSFGFLPKTQVQLRVSLYTAVFWA